jgi:RNA polymerase sigma-70 factor (ECF subfamily)
LDPDRAAHDRFLALVEAHRGALAKVCWAYGRTAHDREDLFQEIVGRLWSAFGSYDAGRPFATWMYRVALNVAIDARRRRRRRGREVSGFEPDAAPEAATDPAREERLRELRDLVESLDDPDRALLLLHLEGHSHAEIGAVLGLGASNVGTRLSRLRRALRESAGGPGGGTRDGTR